MTRIIAVIPARMGSSRFPGKPLALLCGRPMIEHVFSRTSACTLLDEVFIATCDEEIASIARGFGAKTVMTSATHEGATDRVAEASATDPAEIVVMVQGDEPMIRPEMVEAAVKALLNEPSRGCVNLAAPVRTEQELHDTNTIKTVVSRDKLALYFSREPIPTVTRRPFREGEWVKQVCVMAFRADVLQRFANLPRGPLEAAESVDMLRFLESGIPVYMVKTDIYTHAVDTPRDLALVASLIEGESCYAADGNVKAS